MTKPAAAPKLFVSYSWTAQDHEAWVIELAEELVSQGVQVILDKWDLQPGHDANAFMESMVVDPSVTKVILVCDQKYVEKSNSRSGGAGTEAQIITPELYAKKAQDKFVAVVRERDEAGRAYLPVYYGSRIYIDLSNPASYAAEFERLVRWAWDQPLHVRPEMGAKPSFLAGDRPAKIATSVAFRRAMDALRLGGANAGAAMGEYLSIVSSGLESFRLKRPSENNVAFDDLVANSIEEFLPVRNEVIELLSVISQYSCTEENIIIVHRFFESLLPYMERPESVRSWNDTDFDNFKFIINELFLYAIGVFIKFEKFEAAEYLLGNEYYWAESAGKDEKMHPFMIFSQNVKSLSIRNERLKLNRLSVHADMLKERAVGTGIDFGYIMAADLVLYLRGVRIGRWHRWWPDTLLYAGRFAGAFEMFARAKSTRYFEKIKPLLGVNDKGELGSLIEEITKSNMVPRWQFERVSIGRLSGYEALATTP